jgi:hypothetical protein
MNTRTIGAVSLICGLVASPVTLAWAGGGGLGLGNTLLFQCYTIRQGEKPPEGIRRFEVNDLLGDPQTVRLGKARMVCALADALLTDAQLNMLRGVAVGDHFVCYETLGNQNRPGDIEVADAFGSQSVTAGQSEFLCAGADRTQ